MCVGRGRFWALGVGGARSRASILDPFPGHTWGLAGGARRLFGAFGLCVVVVGRAFLWAARSKYFSPHAPAYPIRPVCPGPAVSNATQPIGLADQLVEMIHQITPHTVRIPHTHAPRQGFCAGWLAGWPEGCAAGERVWVSSFASGQRPRANSSAYQQLSRDGRT